MYYPMLNCEYLYAVFDLRSIDSNILQTIAIRSPHWRSIGDQPCIIIHVFSVMKTLHPEQSLGMTGSLKPTLRLIAFR